MLIIRYYLIKLVEMMQMQFCLLNFFFFFSSEYCGNSCNFQTTRPFGVLASLWL